MASAGQIRLRCLITGLAGTAVVIVVTAVVIVVTAVVIVVDHLTGFKKFLNTIKVLNIMDIPKYTVILFPESELSREMADWHDTGRVEIPISS